LIGPSSSILSSFSLFVLFPFPLDFPCINRPTRPKAGYPSAGPPEGSPPTILDFDRFLIAERQIDGFLDRPSPLGRSPSCALRRCSNLRRLLVTCRPHAPFLMRWIFVFSLNLVGATFHQGMVVDRSAGALLAIPGRRTCVPRCQFASRSFRRHSPSLQGNRH
jgi:hypothetical protein